MSTADEAFRFCRLFEAELLLELMLRQWHHPLVDDREFRNDLIESATEILRASVEGERFLEDVPPQHMNFVAATWYAEWSAVQGASSEMTKDQRDTRTAWLESVRHSLPGCFCDPEDLPE